jgi:hypothetical protein
MRIRTTVIAAVILLLLTSTGAWAQGSGVVEGQVLNGSADNAPVAGLPVTLWVYTTEEAQDSFETITDSEGQFLFEDIETEGRAYTLEAQYQGVSYESEVVAFAPGDDVLSQSLIVYEPTTSSELISVERGHLIVVLEPGTIYVQEVQVFSNAGNMAYVGASGEEGSATLSFPLPEGASALQLVEGLRECCVVETDEGFASTRPLLPGSTQLVFSYQLRHDSSTYDFSREIAYPVASLDVLITDVGAEVAAPGLTSTEPLSLQGKDYLHLTAQNLTPLDDVILHFTNLPTGAMPEAPTDPVTIPSLLVWSVLGVITLGVFLALAYPFFESSREEQK